MRDCARDPFSPKERNTSLKRLLLIATAMLALAVPTALASGSVTILGKTATYISKGKNCKDQYYVTGVYKNQGLESCPAGRSERLEWKARGYFTNSVVEYHGLKKCMHPVKFLHKGGFTRSQWRVGNTTVGCSVRVKHVVFS